MATLTGQSIASSYEQLLHVDTDGGGNSTTHVSVKDGDNGTTFALTLATDAVMITSTNRLEFGDDGTYINQSGDGILNITSDTEVEINATAVDLNGTLDVSGNAQLSGTVTVGADGSGTDVIFYSGTAGDNFTWDASEECLIITGTDAAQALKVADGDLVVVDKIYLYDNDGGEYLSSDGTDLTITSGNDIVLSPTGNVGIGIAAPDNNLHVHNATAGSVSAAAASVMTIENSSHAFLQFLSPNNVYSGIYFGDVDANTAGELHYNHSNDSMGFITNASVRMSIASGGDVTFTGDLIMADGKGIDFAADASPAAGMTAEILDDYETGTWDAVVTDGSNPMTMDDDTGYYTKVGNLVTVSGYFKTTSLGSASGDIKITGLPFTVANDNAAYAGGAAAWGYNLAITAGHSVSYHANANTTYMELNIWDATSGTSGMQASEWSADGRIIIGFSYRAA